MAQVKKHTPHLRKLAMKAMGREQFIRDEEDVREGRIYVIKFFSLHNVTSFVESVFWHIYF